MTQWNQILTNTGTYWLLGKGGEGLPSYPYFLRAGQAYKDNPAAYPDSLFDFVESLTGQLFLRDVGAGSLLRWNGSGFVFTQDDPTPIVPDEAGGNVTFRFDSGGGVPKYLAMDSTPQGDWVPLAAADDPHDPSVGVYAQWQLMEQSAPAPDTALERWLHTYIPENRFSAYEFLEHVRRVVTCTDEGVHDTATYLANLTVPVANSIRVKIGKWMTEFAAATALQRAEGQGAMLLASSHFYNAPGGEFNELDPDVPPDWTGVDAELGGDPYPG